MVEKLLGVVTVAVWTRVASQKGCIFASIGVRPKLKITTH